MTSPKGKADYYEHGTWNAVCYECGGKFKANQLLKHWQGYYVCRNHWEPRHPQDFVKATADKQTPPWTQPEPADSFVATDTYITTIADDYILTEDGDSFITE